MQVALSIATQGYLKYRSFAVSDLTILVSTKPNWLSGRYSLKKDILRLSTTVLFGGP